MDKKSRNTIITAIATGVVLAFGAIIIHRMIGKNKWISNEYNWHKNNNNRAEIDKLHPSVKWKFAEFLARAEKELGMDLFITSGYRDMAKQEQLYSQNPSNAPAGRSYHNYGFAIDVNSNTPHLRKASSKQKWIDSGLVALGKELGMKWGGDFHSYHDPVHFVFKPKDIDTLQAYYNTGHVDRNGYVKV